MLHPVFKLLAANAPNERASSDCGSLPTEGVAYGRRTSACGRRTKTSTTFVVSGSREVPNLEDCGSLTKLIEAGEKRILYVRLVPERRSVAAGEAGKHAVREQQQRPSTLRLEPKWRQGHLGEDDSDDYDDNR